MQSKIIAAVLAASLAAAPSAFAKSGKKFLGEAIQGNLAEVQMGQLAQKNASSPDVKAYGEMLVKDHTAANEKATAAANEIGMSVPSQPTSRQKREYDKMAAKTGADFDRAFVQHMQADHRKDVSEYTQAAKGKDAAARYASETLPTLKEHLSKAQSLGQGTKQSSAQGSSSQ